MTRQREHDSPKRTYSPEMYYLARCNTLIKAGMPVTNSIKNLRSKKAKSLVRGIALFFAVLFIAATATANFAVAQTPQSAPSQIPNYNLPPDEQSKQNITIPDQPSNPGVPEHNLAIQPQSLLSPITCQ